MGEMNLFQKINSLQKLIKESVYEEDILIGIEEDTIDLKHKIKSVKEKISLLSASLSNDTKILDLKKKITEIRSRKVLRSEKDEIHFSDLQKKYNELKQAYEKTKNEDFDIHLLNSKLNSLKNYLDTEKGNKNVNVEENFNEVKYENNLSEYKKLFDEELAEELEYVPIVKNKLYNSVNTMLNDLNEFVKKYYEHTVTQLYSDLDVLRGERLDNSKSDKVSVKQLRNELENIKSKCEDIDKKFDFDALNKEIDGLLDIVEFSRRLDFQKEDILKLSLEKQVLFLKEKVLDEKTKLLDYQPVPERNVFKNLLKKFEELKSVVEDSLKVKNLKHELNELIELQNKYRSEDEKEVSNLQHSLNLILEISRSKGLFNIETSVLETEIKSLFDSIKGISTKNKDVINDENNSYDFQLRFYKNQILNKKNDVSDYKPIREKKTYQIIEKRLKEIEAAIQRSLDESHSQKRSTDSSDEIASLQSVTKEKIMKENEPNVGYVYSTNEGISSRTTSLIDKEEFVKTFREMATNDDIVRNILSDIVTSKEDTSNFKEKMQEVGIKKRIDWDESVDIPTSATQSNNNQFDPSEWDETISSSEDKHHELDKLQSASTKNVELKESVTLKNDHLTIPKTNMEDDPDQKKKYTLTDQDSTNIKSANKVVVEDKLNENPIDGATMQNKKLKNDIGQNVEENKKILDTNEETFLKGVVGKQINVVKKTMDLNKTTTTYKRSKGSLQRRLQKSRSQLELNFETDEKFADIMIPTNDKNEKNLHEMSKEDIATTHLPFTKRDIENKIGGKTKYAIELVMSFPEDISYVFEPIVLWWFSLLPEEYQNHFYGFSWTVVVSTILMGLILVILFTCINSSKSRKRKEELQHKLVRELKEQVKFVANEKVLVENKLIQSSEKIRTIDEVFENKSNETKSLQEISDKLKDELSKEKEKFAKNSQSLDESNKEIQSIKKEIEKLNHKVEKKERALTESRTNNNDLSLKVKELTNDIKNQKKLFENEEKEKSKKESTLKDKINTNDILKKKLTESEEKFKMLINEKENVEIEKEEAKKKMMAAISEKEVLQDCLVQTESRKKTLLNDEDADSDEIEEKIVERIKGLFDCSRANKEISVKEEEKLQLISQLETEKKNTKQFEMAVTQLTFDLKSLQQKLVHEEKEKTT